MANCSQINNTTITGTSAFIYDGTPLPCTDIKTCDDLNTILAKLDAVVCNVTASVDILIEEVTNITEDVMIIGEDIINIDNQLNLCCPICTFSGTATELPPTTTTTSSSSSTSTTSTSSSTTTTTTTVLYCEFTGTADQLPDVTTTTTTTVALDCEFTGTADEVTTTTTTSTTTICTRPEGLVTVEYFNTYTYNGGTVDYTSSLLDACAACNFIKDNPFDIQQETSLFGQSGSFEIEQYVYAGLVTDCLPLADGFYITDHETCQIAEIHDGYIVNISNCELTPTTTTTTTTIKLPCSDFELQGLTGGGSWTGLDCYTEVPVGDSVPEGLSEFTGCIISSSLEVTNLAIKGEIPCSTTTTTTTLLSACYIVEGIWEVDDPAHPAGGYVDYIDEFGNNQSLSGLWVIDSINIIASSIITSSGVTITPC
jgi:hypothetical protein